MTRAPATRPRSVAIVLALGIVAGGYLRACFGPVPEPVEITRADTAAAKLWRERNAVTSAVLARVMDERDGLRGQLQRAQNRIRGLEARRPDRITLYDTLLVLPDSLPALREVTPRGRAHIDVYTRADSIHYRPGVYSVDVSDCDRGIIVGAGGVVCRRAPLGHLTLFADVGAGVHAGEAPKPIPRAALGVAWTPAFRSTLALHLEVDLERRAMVSVRKGLRLF